MWDFERAYADHAEALLGFIFLRTGDRTLAEDLVADTFERALRAERRFDRRRGSEKNWLYAIAVNLVRDHQRRAQVSDRVHGDLAAERARPETDAALQVAERDWLAQGLRGLTEDEQEVIALRFGADLTVPEIAALTGQSLTTAEGRVYRALRKLRETMDR